MIITEDVPEESFTFTLVSFSEDVYGDAHDV